MNRYNAAQSRFAAMGGDKVVELMVKLDAAALAMALPSAPDGNVILSIAEKIGVDAVGRALARCTPEVGLY